MGHPIKIAGKDVTYLTAGERIASADMDAIGFDLLEDRSLESHPRLRRVLTTLVRPAPRFYGVLHWSDGSDLEELDQKVISGLVADEDFAGALLAEPRTIVCRGCGAQVRALAVDTGQALFAGTLAARLRDHKLKSSCPSCGIPLGLPIVEFLEE
jgi:hypothetical protein